MYVGWISIDEASILPLFVKINLPFKNMDVKNTFNVKHYQWRNLNQTKCQNLLVSDSNGRICIIPVNKTGASDGGTVSSATVLFVTMK